MKTNFAVLKCLALSWTLNFVAKCSCGCAVVHLSHWNYPYPNRNYEARLRSTNVVFTAVSDGSILTMQSYKIDKNTSFLHLLSKLCYFRSGYIDKVQSYEKMDQKELFEEENQYNSIFINPVCPYPTSYCKPVDRIT